MKKTLSSNSLSLIVCIVLTAAIALFTTACSANKTVSSASPSSQTEVSSIAEKVDSPEKPASDKQVMGEGSTVFSFDVTDGEGKKTDFEIHTDKKTVGEALLDLGLIAGDDSEFGLYVKTVNGVTVDYDTDGKYWAFYVNGEYAASGVDSTEIADGAVYSFKVE